MKQFLLFMLFILPILSWGQSEKHITTSPQSSSISQRLNIDFEVKNRPNVPESLLLQLDLNKIEEHRKKDSRNEYVDPNTNLTIIVYAATEATNNKSTTIREASKTKSN